MAHSLSGFVFLRGLHLLSSIRLLIQCVDGGGVRGLAELLILQRIFVTMEAIITEENGIAPQSLLPSDYFDLIGGTSTGG